MALQEAELMENIRAPLALNLDSDEEVVLITDTVTNERIWQSALKAARALGIDPIVCIVSKRDTPGLIPDPVKRLMLTADACILVTDTPILFGEARFEAMQNGVKMISLEGRPFEVVARRAAAADYEAIHERAVQIGDLFTEAETLRITSPLGVDLEADIRGRPGVTLSGIIQPQPGDSFFQKAHIPEGEVAVAPVEDSTSGTIVWDISMDLLGSINTPIRAQVERGSITDLAGGADTERLRAILESVEADDAWKIGELAVGLNPAVELCGNTDIHKKAAGTVHVGVGANTPSGGALSSPLHLDGVISDPTVWLDDRMLVESGDLVE